MIWTPLFATLHSFLQELYALLPSWTITIGNGCQDGQTVCPGSDQSIIHYGLQSLMQFDRLIPIHDGFFPIMLIIFATVSGFLIFKLILSIWNAARGSGV
jgi:hypothetical protein